MAEFGHPLAFVEVESAPGWDQGGGPRTWFKVAFLGTVLQGPARSRAALRSRRCCLAALLLLRRVWRRFGWGYVAYCVGRARHPALGTKDFMGSGRYVLAAFPVHGRGRRHALLAPATARVRRSTAPRVVLLVATVAVRRGYEVS